MRNHQLDLGDVDFASAQCFLASSVHGVDGVLEGFLAIHAQEVQSGFDGIHRGRTTAPPAGHAQKLRLHAVSSPWASCRCCKIAAPAPSPKRTHVLRSFQSTIVESFSAPITSTVS